METQRAERKVQSGFPYSALIHDVLWSAWQLVRRNDGGPGIDQQTIEDIVNYGEDRMIDEIMETLKSKTYEPQPVKRVHIPKGNGKTRPRRSAQRRE